MDRILSSSSPFIQSSNGPCALDVSSQRLSSILSFLLLVSLLLIGSDRNDAKQRGAPGIPIRNWLTFNTSRALSAEFDQKLLLSSSFHVNTNVAALYLTLWSFVHKRNKLDALDVSDKLVFDYMADGLILFSLSQSLIDERFDCSDHQTIKSSIHCVGFFLIRSDHDTQGVQNWRSDHALKLLHWDTGFSSSLLLFSLSFSLVDL